jgi:hypothetical protein
VGVNKNGLNQSDIPIIKKDFNKRKKLPKGVNFMMREREQINK